MAQGSVPGVRVLAERLVAAVKQSVPTPSITSGPSGPTSSTTATFAFTDSQPGVAFKCSLDAVAFSSCTSPITYVNLAQGGHTFRVRAESGGLVSSAASRAWTVDTVAPPAPTIIQAPDNPSSDTSPTFGVRDTEAGVSFRCRLDSGSASPCDQSPQYKNLPAGDHCFFVQAVDAAGNVSPATSYCWTILLGKVFGISGSVQGALYPGATRPVDLVFRNPYNFDIKIVDVAITLTSSNPACPIIPAGHPDWRNFQVVRPFNPGPVAVVIPANSTRSLSDLTYPTSPSKVRPEQWPQIEMPNLDMNQDGCKGTTFTLSYSGTATKP
jgi:hypothetical protein